MPSSPRAIDGAATMFGREHPGQRLRHLVRRQPVRWHLLECETGDRRVERPAGEDLQLVGRVDAAEALHRERHRVGVGTGWQRLRVEGDRSDRVRLGDRYRQQVDVDEVADGRRIELHQRPDHVEDVDREESAAGADLDVILLDLAPHGDVAGIAGGRLVLPRQDGADAGQHRRRTELAQRREHDPDDVDVGMVEVAGAVAIRGDVVDPGGGDAGVDPTGSEVDEEPDVLDRTGGARPAAVPHRLLDDDRRLQPVELGAVRDAPDLLVRGCRTASSSTALNSSPSWLSFSVPK